MQSAHRLEVLDALRGIAALMVALYHFSATMKETLLGTLFSMGWLGVEVFFVISGFIIPYSMWRSGYKLRHHYGAFMWKRILRLYPAYLMSMLLAIAVGYAATMTPGYQGAPPAYSWMQVMWHIPLLAEVFGYSWIAGVFWTLAIELQYYVVLGLVFPMLQGAFRHIIVAFLAMLALSFLPVSRTWLLPYLPFFLAGVATFLNMQGRFSIRLWLGALALSALVSWFTFGWQEALVLAMTSVAIVFYKITLPRPFLAMGMISYSFYLIHSTLGNKLINLSSRLPFSGLWWDIVQVLAALLLAVVCAWLLYRFVELPSQRWSSRIKFKKSSIRQDALSEIL